MVAAEESARRGAGIKGALKSLIEIYVSVGKGSNNYVPGNNAVLGEIVQEVLCQATGSYEVLAVLSVGVHCSTSA